MQILREQKLYPLNYEFSEKEFEDIWLNNKPLKENREIRLKLQFIENNAYNLHNGPFHKNSRIAINSLSFL